MQDFIKTIRGLAEIEQRAMALNARQRQLLFLIDTPAFTQLSPPQRQRIATRELLQDLLRLNLITFRTDETAQEHRVFKKQMQHKVELVGELNASDVPIKPAEAAAKTRNVPVAVEFKVLSFKEIQLLMIERLQQFCGLMAKPMIEKIAHAQSVAELKNCQIQWITILQESHMPAVQLSQSLQQINFAMKAL